jgi:hypothetical protein
MKLPLDRGLPLAQISAAATNLLGEFTKERYFQLKHSQSENRTNPGQQKEK